MTMYLDMETDVMAHTIKTKYPNLYRSVQEQHEFLSLFASMTVGSEVSLFDVIDEFRRQEKEEALKDLFNKATSKKPQHILDMASIVFRKKPEEVTEEEAKLVENIMKVQYYR